MPLNIKCPHPDCGATYQVRETDLGRAPRCKRCGHKFSIKGASRETAHPAAPYDTIKPATAAAQPTRPQKLGRFEIRARLGAGAFGTVYRAYDPVLDREVALKVPHAGTLQTDKDKARFLQEAKSAGRLRKGRNITRIRQDEHDYPDPLPQSRVRQELRCQRKLSGAIGHLSQLRP